MESCQVVIGNNKIEFHGVRNTYPTGQLVTCYYTVPTQYRPESGDWIGIYPVGWSTLGHYLCKKMVQPENVWSTPAGQQYGKIEFETELLPQGDEQSYQFVYVKNGECVRGASTPFMFNPMVESWNNGPRDSVEAIFGGKQQSQNPLEQLVQEQQQQPRFVGGMIEQVVEQEMQKLQNGIFGLEQGLNGYKSVFPPLQETNDQQWFQQQLFGGGEYNNAVGVEMLLEQVYQPHQIRKHWQSRVADVQQMLIEQVKIEQGQRRIEQLNILAQLKSYERHLVNVQKHEETIKQYLRAKVATKVAEFEQKVYQIYQQQQERLNTIVELVEQQQPQPEHYVRKYEQLLKEKIELDIQKRIAIQHKLRQTIRECERKLREIQTGEQQHYARFHQILKVKVGQFETKFVQPAIYAVVGTNNGPIAYSQKIEGDLRTQLKHQVAELLNEQRQQQYQLIKAHKQLGWLCQEINDKLQELECGDIYSQLRIPKVYKQTLGGLYAGVQQPQPHYAQLYQLEQQLNELKNTLRIKYGKQHLQVQLPRTIVEQLTTGVWLKPIAQKLRELEWNLKQEKLMQLESPIEMPTFRATWYERRIQNLNQHMKQLEQVQTQQQIEEYKLRELLGQLRDLECELCEYPQFYKQLPQQLQQQQPHQYRQQQQVVELCQMLQTVVREKIGQLAPVYEQYQQCSPIECFIQSGNHSAWKKLIKYERKLVQLKGMLVEKQQYYHMQQRLAELEQALLLNIKNTGKQQQQQQLRCVEQIRRLRDMLEQRHYQQQQQQQQQELYYQQQQQQVGGHYLFATPEQFVQHQQKYERLLQLVNDLEYQVVEQQPIRFPNVSGLFGKQCTQHQWQQREQQQWQPREQQQWQPREQQQWQPREQQQWQPREQQQWQPREQQQWQPREQQQWQQREQQQQTVVFGNNGTVVGLNVIHQRFERIVQEFQQRVTVVEMPQSVVERVELIGQYLRNVLATEAVRGKSCFGQQLKEKICEFEQVLGLEQLIAGAEQPFGLQQQPTWFVQGPTTVQQYVRQVAKQVRELKQQIQTVLEDWVLVNGEEQQQQLFDGDMNNNLYSLCSEIYEPTVEETYTTKDGLIDLYTVRKQLSNEYETIPRSWSQQQFEMSTSEWKKAERQLERQLERHFERQLERQLENPCEWKQGGERQSERQTERQLERQIERQIERQLEKQQQQQQQQLETVSDFLTVVPTTTATLTTKTTATRSSSVENLISELESELVKLRLQKEYPTSSVYPTYQPESLSDEFAKVVGQNLLTTVVKVAQQQQQQQQEKIQQQTTTSTVYNVEPTPFGTSTQCVKTQQKETTIQQQQQQQF